MSPDGTHVPSASAGQDPANELAQARSRAVELSRRAEDLGTQNRRLVDALRRCRETIDSLRASLERDGDFPATRAVIVERNAPIEDAGSAIPSVSGAAVDIFHAGRIVRTTTSPLLDDAKVQPGAHVLVNESLVVVAILDTALTGAVLTVADRIDEKRLVVAARTGERQVVTTAEALRKQPPRVGELVLVDPKTSLALETVTVNAGTSGLQLAQVPETTYQMIGGLDQQIAQVRDAIELPFLHHQKYEEYGLEAPRGVLLYGPPGTGKTMIAQAVAHALSQQTGSSAYFLNVKGPELLDKFVGETERHIRVIFDQARAQAEAGHPVVVFFDEMDALFRTRGTGVSSDVETTIVPQLLAEIDGVEKLSNVLVVGATNREDMLDPAVLRPGRLDVKVGIERPDRNGALDILGLYLTQDLPLAPTHAVDEPSNARTTSDEPEEQHADPAAVVAGMREAVVAEIFDQGQDLVELEDADGHIYRLGRADVVSGAVLKAIVDRAKRDAIKREIKDGKAGLDLDLLRQAVAEEFAQAGHLPAAGAPEDWARILGADTASGAKIVRARRLNLDDGHTDHRGTA